MQIRYQPHIDGLRAIAVTIVILFHYFPDYFPGGFIGVDVFFGISGFLITSILLKNLDEGKLSLLTFYHNRVCRILPALIVVLVTCLLAGQFLLLHEEYKLLGKHTYYSVIFYQNFNLLKESGYFDLASDLKPLLHIWSLSLEEQFYLLWPLIFIVFKKKKSWIKNIIFVLIAYSFYYCLKTTDNNLSKAFYSIKSRFWELGLGGVTAYYISKTRVTFKGNNPSMIGFLGLIGCVFLMSKATVFPGWIALIPMIATVLVISDSETSIVNKLLSNKFLIWLGKISYPLYLWHWPVLVIARINSPELRMSVGRSFEIKIICFLISFLLSIGTYYFIENPVKSLKEKYKFKLSIFILAVLLLLGFIGNYLFKNGSPLIKFKTSTKNISLVIPKVQDCMERLGLRGVEWCRTTAIKSMRDVVIIGDSHGEALFEAFALHYQKKNRDVTVIGTGETVGFINTGYLVGNKGDKYSFEGIRTLDLVFEWVLKEPPKTIILVSRGPYNFLGQGFGQDNRSIKLVDLTDPGKDLKNNEIFLRGLDRTLKQLTEKHIETVFVFDNFELGFKPEDMCIKRPTNIFSFKVLEVCGVRKDVMLKRYSPYKEQVDKILKRYPNVKSFSPNDSLCDNSWCYAIKDEVLLYSDHNHLSESGANLVLQNFK